MKISLEECFEKFSCPEISPTKVGKMKNEEGGCARVGTSSFVSVFCCYLQRDSTAGACVSASAALGALFGVN